MLVVEIIHRKRQLLPGRCQPAGRVKVVLLLAIKPARNPEIEHVHRLLYQRLKPGIIETAFVHFARHAQLRRVLLGGWRDRAMHP